MRTPTVADLSLVPLPSHPQLADDNIYGMLDDLEAPLDKKKRRRSGGKKKKKSGRPGSAPGAGGA